MDAAGLSPTPTTPRSTPGPTETQSTDTTPLSTLLPFYLPSLPPNAQDSPPTSTACDVYIPNAVRKAPSAELDDKLTYTSVGTLISLPPSTLLYYLGEEDTLVTTNISTDN